MPINGRVAACEKWRGSARDVAFVEVVAEDDEPAGGFADEHLRGLDDGHGEAADFGGVGGVAVGDALEVLRCVSLHELLVVGIVESSSYLILGQEGVADAC